MSFFFFGFFRRVWQIVSRKPKCGVHIYQNALRFRCARVSFSVGKFFYSFLRLACLHAHVLLIVLSTFIFIFSFFFCMKMCNVVHVNLFYDTGCVVCHVDMSHVCIRINVWLFTRNNNCSLYFLLVSFLSTPFCDFLSPSPLTVFFLNEKDVFLHYYVLYFSWKYISPFWFPPE